MQSFEIGEWRFEAASGTLSPINPLPEGGTPESSPQRLEPKVADLLLVLVDRGGRVATKDDLMTALWPDVVVGDDALPRCVSKLRRALGDDPKAPRFIATVPKRGYRLLVDVNFPRDGEAADQPRGDSPRNPAAPTSHQVTTDSALDGGRRERESIPYRKAARILAVVLLCAGVWWASRWMASERPDPTTDLPRSNGGEAAAARQWVQRADDFYTQINRRSNESAIDLYERALADSPDLAPAHAGLANALVQRVMRYPTTEGLVDIEPVNLGNALASGRLNTDEARNHLRRALGLAERSVRLAPRSAASHKALGFVHSALGHFATAEHSYRRAVELNPDAWDALINLGDIHEIQGEKVEALEFFEAAYDAMTGLYDSQGQRVGPWIAELGVSIGDRHEALADLETAEVWYRRVLAFEPLHPAATCALARSLRRAGDPMAAQRLEEELWSRLGEAKDCRQVLQSLRAQ